MEATRDYSHLQEGKRRKAEERKQAQIDELSAKATEALGKYEHFFDKANAARDRDKMMEFFDLSDRYMGRYFSVRRTLNRLLKES